MEVSDTLVVVPAYNESARVGEVVKDVRAVCACTVAVVDDCSADDTSAQARAAGAIVLRHALNLRYGAAVQTGIRYAVAKGFRYLAQMDGDGQHDARCLEDILRPVIVGEADYVLGSRFLPRAGASPYRGSLVRRAGSHVLSALVRLFTGLRISDPTSGFVAMNRRTMEALAGDAYPHDYPDADVIILLHRRGFRVREVPVRMVPGSGKSMHAGVLRPLYYAYKMSLSILMTLLRT